MTPQSTAPLINLQTEVLYQDEYIKIELDRHIKFIYVEWLQHPGSEEFRMRFKKAAELTIANECLYWLSDSRAIHYLEFSDQNWMMTHIFPLLPECKLIKFARISSLQSIALMDTARISNNLEAVKSCDLNVELDNFTSKETALQWLFAEA